MIPAHLVEKLSTALARWDGRGPTEAPQPHGPAQVADR